MSHPLLPSVVELVRAAGQAILPYWRSALQVREKADASPVTAADMAAHALLARGLHALAADIPLLSEEDCDISLQERSTWTRWWLVDPLDGTKEFIQRSGEFTVNIALIEAGVPVLGVVHLPVTRVTYLGVAPAFSPMLSGAWKYTGDQPPQPIHVRSLAQPREDNELIVLASRRHGTEALSQLMTQLGERWPGQITLSNAGSSLKFCRIAEGLADFYPRLAPTSEWDTAAAQAVLEAAGGAVVNAEATSGGWLEALVYNRNDTLINPGFFAWGDKGLDWAALLQRA